MNQSSPSIEAPKRPYEAPRLRRVARVPLATAGSFDLVIPNAP